MNVVQTVNAIIQSPEIAIMAAQAVQGNDLVARQVAASMVRDMERQRDQVMDPEEMGAADATGQDQRQRDYEARRSRRRALMRADGAAPGPDDLPQHRLDILA